VTRVVHAPIGDVGDALTILDAGRRLYAALSRDGTYWHVVSPLQADRLDAEGNVVRAAGALSCICKGATFHGTCYQQMNAEAFEAGDFRLAAPILAPPDWARADLSAGVATFDAPVGAGHAVQAERG